MSPAEQLRAAAAKIRDTAKHAAPAPWTCSPVWSPDSKSTSGVYSSAFPTGTVDSEVVASGRVKSGYGGIRNPHNAVWITLMSPAVAEPLAAWLDDMSREYERTLRDHGPDAATYAIYHAMPVARAILGEAP